MMANSAVAPNEYLGAHVWQFRFKVWDLGFRAGDGVEGLSLLGLREGVLNFLVRTQMRVLRET